MSDTFTTLNDALAGFGITLTERTRLAFGAPVMKALADVGTGGKVFVATSGGQSLLVPRLPVAVHEAPAFFP